MCLFKNKFMNATNYDPAIYDMDEGCAYNIGYETKCLGDGAPRCRLCATCAVNYKRKVQDGMARCNSCPEKTENTFLLIAGFVVVLILVLVFKFIFVFLSMLKLGELLQLLSLSPSLELVLP